MSRVQDLEQELRISITDREEQFEIEDHERAQAAQIYE